MQTDSCYVSLHLGKATWQCFPEVIFIILFIMLYKVALTFESMDEILWCDHSYENYRSSTFLWCCVLRSTKWFQLLNLWTKYQWFYHSNKSYWAVLSCGTVYYAVQNNFNFCNYGRNPMVWLFKWELLSSTFLWYCTHVCSWSFSQ